MTLAGFMDKLSNKSLIFCINLVFFLILLSPQFAEATPIESDGWWFLSIAERYGEYGNDETEFYLSRMITLIPLDMISRIFPNHVSFFASIMGMIISAFWITLCFNSILHHSYAQKMAIPVALLVSFLMVTWWSPLQYTAQMLSLLFFAYIIHKIPHDNSFKYSYILCIFLIPLTHLQSPLILCSIFLVESFLRTKYSRNSRIIFFIIGYIFVIWNFTIASSSFTNQIPTQFRDDIQMWHPLAIIFTISILSLLVEKRYGIRKVDVWGGRRGISNLSIIIGCILIIPLMYYGDIRMGAARLVPRLLAYAIVPLSFWFLICLSFCYKKINSSNLNNNRIYSLFFILSIIAGSLASTAHVNYSSRTLMIPSETNACWEMTEDAGLVGLMLEYSNEPNHIIHSPVMLPMSDFENFWFFLHLGDESRINSVNPVHYSALLQTADINHLDLIGTNLDSDIFETWYVAGEVPGACRLLVNPDDVKFLDITRNWDYT